MMLWRRSYNVNVNNGGRWVFLTVLLRFKVFRMLYDLDCAGPLARTRHDEFL